MRTSGCNLRCWFCDTPYTSWQPEGHDIPVEEIVAQVEEWDCRHAVLTGGEPMLFAELIPLAEQLQRRSWHITIETAGTLYLPVPCDLMSLSPHLPSCGPAAVRHPRWSLRHERERFKPAVLRQLMAEYNYQLKFVVDRAAELDEIERFVEELPEVNQQQVLLMPQGTSTAELASRAAWLKPYCHQRGWIYCPRKQIEWYGTVRRT